MIEEFGPRVASVWNHLRTTTRNLVERAWKSSGGGGSVMQIPQSTPYDPRADQELSQLLAALDEHTVEAGLPAGDASREARRLADACASVLTQQTQSAEVFSQLIQRAHQRNDYARVDALAGMLPERLAPSEMCELARSNKVVVRALAQEALTQMPASLLAILLRDPVDALVARHALALHASEYLSAPSSPRFPYFENYGVVDFE